MRIVLKGGNVVVGTGETIDDGVVVLEDDRIAAVGGSDFDTNADYFVDLAGRTLIPGMIDCHIHLVGGDKTIGFDETMPPLMRTDPSAVAKALVEGVANMRTTLHAGFTTVRELGGRDYHDVTLRNAQRAGLVHGPRMLTTGPGVFPSGGLGYHLEPDAGVDSEVDAVKRVRRLVERGVDVIKIVSADGPEPLGQEWTIFPTADEIRWTFAEATRTGRLKAAHAMCHDAIEVVTRAGTDTVEHGWYLTEQNCHTMIEHDVYLIPTASNIWAIIRNGPALNMSWAPMVASDEQRMMDGYRMAIELGVKIAAGTDVGGNISHFYGDSARELEVYVHCGMSQLDAIAAGTLHAAKAIKRADSVGSIEVGKLADLVVIDGDPLSDITLCRTGVVGVVQGGVVHRDDLGLFVGMRAPAGAASPA